MNTRTRLAAFLLLLWAMPYWAVRFYFAHQESLVEDRVQASLSTSDTEEGLFYFALPRADSSRHFRWEHESEFEYQGRMFDVVRKEIRNDSLLLWCIWDEAETELKKSRRALATSSPAAPVSESCSVVFASWQVFLIPSPLDQSTVFWAKAHSNPVRPGFGLKTAYRPSIDHPPPASVRSTFA